jgi:hypothetical protein
MKAAAFHCVVSLENTQELLSDASNAAAIHDKELLSDASNAAAIHDHAAARGQFS